MFQSFRQQGQEFLTELDGRAVGKVGENDVFQFVELVFDGGVNFIVAVAEEIAPPGTDDIDVFFPVYVLEITAFAVVDDDWREDFGIFHLLGGMPDVF